LNQDSLRDVMARFPAGVVVVAARDEVGLRGLTATSFTAVSLEPPLILVCIDQFSATRDAITGAGMFAVSLLARRQEFLAERFSGRAPAVDPTWKEIAHRLGANGMPMIDGAAAWVECDLEDVHPAGDHDIVIGRVTAAEAGEGEPLVHWDRAFWRLTR
jgi:3-hydroxy-9,10-secoandrosta-1,3,5(10)-triene-9,17-dione monooxygenase reductase component